MNESQNKVIDKIEKLLALAGSDNEMTLQFWDWQWIPA